MNAGSEADGRTRLDVREFVSGFMTATAAMLFWPGLNSASNAQAVAVFFASWTAGHVAAIIVFERRLPWPLRRGREATARAQWMIALRAGLWVGLLVGVTIYPQETYRGFFVHDGMIDVPASVARIPILASAVGLVVWVLALMVPNSWLPARLLQLRDWPPIDEKPKPPPIDPLDLLLFLLALGAVVGPPEGAMDALTAPFAWPWPQFAAACLLLTTMLKRSSIDGARAVYRVVFVVFAILFVRLAWATPSELRPPGGILLGLAFAAILLTDALAYRLGSRAGWPDRRAGQTPI